jgi:biopolymer transport protein ExbD
MRRQRNREEAELNVTSFMNLMIVLVPVLLLNMVFSQLSVLDLKLPTGDQPTVVDPNDVTLEVIIRPDSMQISYSYLLQTVVQATLPLKDGKQDYEGLSATLQEMKKDPVFAEKRDISLLPEPAIDYQTLVSIMDTVRVYPAVLIDTVVDATLFPDISLGNAPEIAAAEVTE